VEIKVNKFILEEGDWGVMIHWSPEGFAVQDNNGIWHVFENSDQDKEEDRHIDSVVGLIHFLLDYFNVNSDRYARRRVYPHVEVGDKYEPKEGEKIVARYYRTIKTLKTKRTKKPEASKETDNERQ